MANRSNGDNNPLDFARAAGGGFLLVATIVALAVWLWRRDARMLQLAGVCWTIYGVYFAFLDGLLDPLLDGISVFLGSVGLMRAGGGYSDIETLQAGGNLEAAAEAYAVRARAGKGDMTALVRRAVLLSGPLGTPALAAKELEDERTRRTLSAADDLKVGAMLARLYEGPLDEPGHAMAELRRLIDRYPGARNARHLRRELAMLKELQFGAQPEER